MRTEHGRKRTELHPTHKLHFVRISQMTAAIGVDVRNAIISASDKTCNLLRKRIKPARYISRPLNRITVRRAVRNAHVISVNHVHRIAHDHGTAVDLFIARLFLIVMPRNILKQVQSESFPINVFRGRNQMRSPIPIVPPNI